MSTAQVFQATRGAAVGAGQMPKHQQALISMGQTRPELDLINDGWWNTESGRVAGGGDAPPSGVEYDELGNPLGYTPNADKAFYANLDPFLANIGKQGRLTASDWGGAMDSFFGMTGTNAGDANWWGPQVTSEARVKGLENLYPSLQGLSAPFTTPEAQAQRNAQQQVMGEQGMARQRANGGGGLFGGIGELLGQIGPLLSIGGLAMGFPGWMDMLGAGAGAGAGLASGGMSFAPEAFASAFIPNASVAAGWSNFAPSLMSGLGAGTLGAGTLDPNAWGGFNAAQGGGGNYFDGGGTWDAGGTEFTPPGMEGGNGGFAGQTSMGSSPWMQAQNFMQNNPWIKNAFSAGRGAMNNRDNPLMGAMMGLGNSFIPGTGGPFSNALGMGSGVLSMFQGMDQNRRVKGAFGELDRMGDPYAGLRASAMSRLADLNADPSGALSRSPGFKAGETGIVRQQAAMGKLGSGNLATALLDYGGNAFNQERASALNQLGVAGDGSQMAMRRAQMASMQGAGNPSIMNGLATLGFGLNRMGL